MDKLFEIEPIKKHKVLSASRMTDMPKYYPNALIEEVEKRRRKGINVHTLVIWTKHPQSLLKNPLFQYLEALRSDGIQLYIQLTITGLGKVVVGNKPNGESLVLEPNAPEYTESLSLLPKIIELTGKPERIRLRIDPVVRIKDFYGKQFTSNSYFSKIVDVSSKYGIKTFSFSFLEKNTHQKVDRHLRKAGCEILPPTNYERKKTVNWMRSIEEKYGVGIFSCSVPNMPISKCIDAQLLQRLHDNKYPASTNQQKKRELCGCSESIDLGGWPPKKCYTGCLYCYANAHIE